MEESTKLINSGNFESDKKGLSKGIKVLIAICVLMVIGVFYYFKIYDGGFSVTQIINTYELGSEQKLLDSLKYDERKIINVSIVNDDGFSINKIGDYDVTFDVINNRKNHKQISYNYHVLDTIAPELVVDKSEIYVAKGYEFNLNNYASSTDKSHTDKIKYDEVFDVDIPGTYGLNVYAEDESGNKSATQAVTVMVEDRDNCDINMANFGDSREVVKRFETKSVLDEGDTGIVYSIEEHGLPGGLCYWFTQEDKLCSVAYEFDTTYEWDTYIEKYPLFREDIINKYGEPEESKEVYDKSLGPGTSLWLGKYVRMDTWDLDNMSISMWLASENSTTTLLIMYNSKEYVDD